MEINKYAHWSGDWNSYLGYLEKNNVLSPNFVCKGGKYMLRDGYVPEPYNPKSKSY